MNVGLLFQQTQNIVNRGPAKSMMQKPLMLEGLDGVLIMLVMSILVIGLVMVASASISIADSKTSTPFFYLYRQLIAATLGLIAAIMIFNIRLVIGRNLE